ncbi:TIGR03915 family putative DNA repair protein [Ohessyouella blattaphilus]|uniref:TIGR03915 family putative DNA repair protein n=1 Tax=Ohessyouella blattaphilus TaxID=2949333 RepID=A0ABT1EK07_9FIRM|nr:TIGR03915 family putative DNA repair protein [Ohessyouella blattaphilus]MCP1110097.1 TIGR03915 family putative DNA repair protein [Ohessyouella blattaphilus]MCR8563491.1 TIGR03915 family putative DNA repair protein [Ohessyouella blattaphilus]
MLKKVYRCSDTVTGIFSGIHDAWLTKNRKEEAGIQIAGDDEVTLFCEYLDTEESNKKALAVEGMIKRYLGYAAYHDIYQACLSFDLKKGETILGTIAAAKELTDSKKIMDHLSNPYVHTLFYLSRNVGGEAHNLTEFIRFGELANGVLYAKITPKNQVLSCIAPHFADRFPEENFMIYDKTHKMFVVKEAKKQWVLVQDEFGFAEATLEYSAEEQVYSALWKDFVSSIAIKERENRRCQMQHLPLWYRGNMTEFC